ncbi:ATP-binding protein [Natrialba swarupiae]|nr:ATP-binding protein [Natrialba swarupiae]
MDLAHSVNRLVSTLREQYPEATIDLDCPEQATATATESIDRAIRELVENAINHSDRETPTIAVSIQTHGEQVQVEIVDDGPGIPSEETKVLTREREVKPLYHGSGLGLWLVNWIVRRSKGRFGLRRTNLVGASLRSSFVRPEQFWPREFPHSATGSVTTNTAPSGSLSSIQTSPP